MDSAAAMIVASKTAAARTHVNARLWDRFASAQVDMKPETIRTTRNARTLTSVQLKDLANSCARILEADTIALVRLDITDRVGRCVKR